MSTPYGGQNPYSASDDPFAKGSAGQGGPSGYPPPPSGQPGSQQGYPGGQQGYPGGQPGYGGQQGYPGGQGGYPGQQGGYPGQQSGYPGQQSGYPGQQSGYPGQQPYPSGPSGHGGYGAGVLPDPPVRPQTVVIAFWCWIATVVVSVIGLFITLNSPIWEQAIAYGARQSNAANINVESLVNGLKIVTVVIALVLIGVYLLFAVKMYGGRNWARIVLTIFGVLGALSALTPTSRTVTVNSQVYDVNTGAWASYVTALLAVVAIVLMYLPQSNPYFKQSLAYRSAQKLTRG